jgi:hypothetical protein
LPHRYRPYHRHDQADRTPCHRHERVHMRTLGRGLRVNDGRASAAAAVEGAGAGSARLALSLLHAGRRFVPRPVQAWMGRKPMLVRETPGTPQGPSYPLRCGVTRGSRWLPIGGEMTRLELPPMPKRSFAVSDLRAVSTA